MMAARRILQKGFLFGIPFLLWMIAVVTIDPFDYFDFFRVIPEPIKVANAASLNEMLFNMMKEVHQPSENLIIGDSRVENFSLDQIKAITGLDYQRLSSNALKLNEAVDLFWFANKRQRLSRVVFGLNFNQYNEYAFADRAHSVEAVIRNPLLYVFDRSVAQAMYYVVKAYMSGRPAFSSLPPMTREEFWNYIVTVRATEHYSKYHRPDGLYRRMQEMVAFAKAQHTEVTFVIVPHHTDFQRRVEDFGLEAEAHRFRRDLKELGVRVVDYDYPNEVTANRANFKDPIHCNDAISSIIVNEVFSGQFVLGRVDTFSSAKVSSRPASHAN
jgi:hypothetical protein